MSRRTRTSTSPVEPVFLSDAVVRAAIDAAIPRIVAELTGAQPALATPAPVVAATSEREMVTYRKDWNGTVKTATRRQFTARTAQAAKLGHTLTEISSTLVSAPAQATPAPVVTATTASKGDRKAINRALAASLRAQGLNPADPQVWAAAKAQAE